MASSSQSGPASSSWITAYCDGGSRGNPGPAGYGVRIEDSSGSKIEELYEFLGVKTNNFAEYSGLLAALAFAQAKGYEQLRVIADSELMVKQMLGKYRVKSPDLRPLYEEAKRRASQLQGFRIEHVLRGKNKHADRLANLAMDTGNSRTVHDLLPSSPAIEPAPVSPVTGSLFAGSMQPALDKPPTHVSGVVKNGVVHFIDGNFPDGTHVTITPTRKK